MNTEMRPARAGKNCLPRNWVVSTASLEQLMSTLDEILQAVKSGRKAYPNWVALRHAYFTGDHPVQECEQWAEKNGIVALFRFKAEPLHHRIVEDVMLLPKRVRPEPQTK